MLDLNSVLFCLLFLPIVLYLLAQRIDSNYIVCRAFRKLNYILKISRENCGKKHKIIILSGKTRENDIKKALTKDKYKYRMEKSITKQESKIVILEKI